MMHRPKPRIRLGGAPPPIFSEPGLDQRASSQTCLKGMFGMPFRDLPWQGPMPTLPFATGVPAGARPQLRYTSELRGRVENALHGARPVSLLRLAKLRDIISERSVMRAHDGAR